MFAFWVAGKIICMFYHINKIDSLETRQYTTFVLRLGYFLHKWALKWLITHMTVRQLDMINVIKSSHISIMNWDKDSLSIYNHHNVRFFSIKIKILINWSNHSSLIDVTIFATLFNAFSW